MYRQPIEFRSPRETMAILPGYLQPFLTWLTGMPLADQKPLFLWTPGLHFWWALILTCVGVVIGIVAVGNGWVALALLPVSLLLTTSGMRYLYAVIEHFCIHNTFSNSRLLNRIVGEVISTALWAAPFDLFRRDHLTHHHTTRTNADPDVHFLIGTGFRPGMSRTEFRRYIAKTIISPSFHLKYFSERLRSNFTGPWYRTAMSCVYAAALFGTLGATDSWMAWILLWVVPVVVPFQIASLINYHSEHPWIENPGTGRQATARVCVGRFCGDPVPMTGAAPMIERAGAWCVWWLRVFFVHLPYRLFVLVGDQSQHDLHHRRPASDWSNAAYARRDDIAAGCVGWPRGYIDVWGTVLDHLDACICVPEQDVVDTHSAAESAANLPLLAR